MDLVAVIFFAAIVFGACSDNQRPGLEKNPVDPLFGVKYSRWSGAETFREVRLKGRTDEELRVAEELIAEIKNVIAQNGLPADVFADDRAKAERDRDDPSNIAITLHHLFHEYYDQRLKYNENEPNGLQKLWDASPIGEWEVDEKKLDSVRTLLLQFEPKRQEVRRMLQQWKSTPERKATRFNYIFNHHPPAAPPTPDSPRTNRPFLYAQSKVDTGASQYLADYALLEEFAIAQALLDGDIHAAIDTLSYIFRIAQLASALGNVGVRGDAAMTRLRAFDVMQRIVLDPKFDKAQMIALRKDILLQHEHWMSEYATWFGDRASGIVLYHLIVMNGLENALERDEFDFVVRQVGTNKFMRGFKKYHEADKAFYLRSMQQILDVSEKPFIERRDVLNQIDADLRAAKDTYDDTGIATDYFVAHLLFRNVEPLMRVFAQDQSALNRAIVAMHRSLGLDSPEGQGNTGSFRDPFTGEPYTVRKVEGLWSVEATMLPRSFRMPDFTSNE